MFPSFVKSLWIRGAITLMSAANLLAAPPAKAEVAPWPASFRAEQMPVTDGTQYVRVGGSGPAVVLLHGFGDTGVLQHKGPANSPGWVRAAKDGKPTNPARCQPEKRSRYSFGVVP